MSYGWIKDPPEAESRVASRFFTSSNLPVQAEIRRIKAVPYVYDQGQMNACVGNVLANLLEVARVRAGYPPFQPSRLFIYNMARERQGKLKSDGGTTLYDGIRVISDSGVCRERQFKYRPLNIYQLPSKLCRAFAVKHRVLRAEKIERSLQELRGNLAAGFPFAFGFYVFDSFEDPRVRATGDIPMPASTELTRGGHAMLATGYDDNRGCFKIVNSYGPQWGLSGCGTIPYDYLMDLRFSGDFWVIRDVKK